MIRHLVARLVERRAHRHVDPFTPQQFALLREVRAEGKALARHRRRRVRPTLLRQGGETSW